MLKRGSTRGRCRCDRSCDVQRKSISSPSAATFRPSPYSVLAQSLVNCVMDTLGFLLPFRLFPLRPLYLLSPHQLFLDLDDFAKALERAFLGKATITNGMRLPCILYDQKLSKRVATGTVCIAILHFRTSSHSVSRRLASRERSHCLSWFKPTPQHHRHICQ
jgi:hypothetical protein